MSTLIEDYAIIGDTQDGRRRRPQRLDRLVVRAPDRLRRGVRRAARRARARPVEHRARAARSRRPAASYAGDSLILETTFETPGGVGEGDRLHVARASSTRRSSASSRACRARSTMHLELIARFDYGSIAPWAQSTGDGLTLVAGSDALRFHSPVPLQDERPHDRGRLHGQGRPAARVLARLVLGARGPAAPARRRRRPARHRGVLVRVDRPVHLPGRVARRRRALAHHGQGAAVRADGRGVRGRHHVVARAARRRPQLGLPLLVAARLVAHAPGPGAERLPRGGLGVAALAPARGRRQPRRLPDHVRRRRGAAAHRGRARLAARVRELEAGPHRQRGERAVPARRLRRDRRRRAHRGRGRARGRRARPGAPPAERRAARRDDGAPRAGLAAPRRRHLGDPRSAATLHAVEGDGVGRVRPRRADVRAAGPHRATDREVAHSSPTRSRPRSARRASTPRRTASCSTTARTSSTPAC